MTASSAASRRWHDQLHRALGGEVDGVLDVLEHSPDAMTLSEAVRREDGRALDMRLLYMNRKAREGQPNPDEAIGELCSVLWPDMVSNGSFQACMRVLDSGDGEQGDFFWTDDATYRPAGYEWRAVRVGSEVLLWVLRDVSDRLRREQAVAEVYERVVQSLTAATMARELGDEDVMATELAAALAAAKVLATRELPAVPAPKTAASPPPPAGSRRTDRSGHSSVTTILLFAGSCDWRSTAHTGSRWSPRPLTAEKRLRRPSCSSPTWF